MKASFVTNIGSLFGSGKMKALERRNEDLQYRIKELEEALQREEQQNSKLSEFVDFVKRYFLYVEKLIPTIKFLCDTLNFCNAVMTSLLKH